MKLTPLLTAAVLAVPLSVLPDAASQAATVTVRPSITVRAPTVRVPVAPRINSTVNAGRAMGTQRAAGANAAAHVPLGQAYRAPHTEGFAYRTPYSTTGTFYPYWPIYLAASSHSRAAASGANGAAVTPAERFLGITRPGANTCEIHQLTANLGDKLPTLDAKLNFIKHYAESANVPVSDEMAAQFKKMEGIWAATCPVPIPVEQAPAPAP